MPVHRSDTGQSAARVPRQPDNRLCDPVSRGGKRAVGKILDKVRDPADSFFPPQRCRQRGAFIGRSDEHGVAELKAPSVFAERRAAFDKIAQNKSAAGVSNNVEFEAVGTWRQCVDQHPCVFFRDPADGKVVERENAFAVAGANALEERNGGKAAKCAGGVGKCSVQEK